MDDAETAAASDRAGHGIHGYVQQDQVDVGVGLLVHERQLQGKMRVRIADGVEVDRLQVLHLLDRHDGDPPLPVRQLFGDLGKPAVEPVRVRLFDSCPPCQGTGRHWFELTPHTSDL